MWFNIEVLSLPPACLAPQLLREQALVMPRQQDLSPACRGTPRLVDGEGRSAQDISFACGFGVWGPSPAGFRCGHRYSAVSSPDKGLMAPVPHPEWRVPGIQLPSKHQLRGTNTNHCVFCTCISKGFLKHQVCSKRKCFLCPG